MYEKHLQRIFNSTEDYWNSIIELLELIGILFDELLGESDYFIMLIFKRPVFYFISGTSCCFQLYRFDKLVIKIVLLLYLRFT